MSAAMSPNWRPAGKSSKGWRFRGAYLSQKLSRILAYAQYEANRAQRALSLTIGLSDERVLVEQEGICAGLGWMPVLSINASAALILGAVAANASRLGAEWSIGGFYLAIAFIYFPIALRMMYPHVSRLERVALLLTVAIALFALRVIREPSAFIDHDEFLHWRTVTDILEYGRLFSPNPLLPVSPLFPGLEIVTAAIVQLSGLSVFGSALLLLGICRMLFIGTLFLVFERITGSHRIGSLGCLLYMGSSTFLVFDNHFSYESLAVVFLALALLSSQPSVRGPRAGVTSSVLLTSTFLAALAITHHMTAFFAGGLFCLFATLEFVSCREAGSRTRSMAIAVIAVAMPMFWSRAMDNPTGDYLGPVIQNGLRELLHLFSTSQGRTLFVAEDGSAAPYWQRALAMGSVVLICAGLATGFVRSLRLAGVTLSLRRPLFWERLRDYENSWLVALTLLTLLYPLSILFRLTKSGWEIGNRIGPFSFLGVALVVAIAVVGFWQKTSGSFVRALVLSAAATVIVAGGVISAEGPRVLVPANFQVSADSASIEPMGISTAEWARDWLGQNNVFASDRINRLLLSTYGRQQLTSTLQDGADASVAVQAPTLRSSDKALLRTTGVDYVLTDLRITTALPVVGVYFDGGSDDHDYAAPLNPQALLKFNSEKAVSRLFDNGYQQIFDVRTIDGFR